MTLNKAIEHGKEHRKPYRGSKVFDPACRNNCGCFWCAGNRQIQKRRMHEKAIYDLAEIGLILNKHNMQKSMWYKGYWY